MRNSFYGRVVHGVSAGLVGQSLIIAQNIVLVPLFLRLWGTALYGDWLAMSAAATYLSMMDAGLQTYSVNLMTIHYSRREYDEFHRVLHSAMLLYLATVLAGMVIIACVTTWIPWNQFLHLRSLGRMESSVVFLLIASSTLVAIPVGLVTGVYRSVGEFARGQQIANIARTALLAATIVAMTIGCGPLFLAGLTALVPLATLAVAAYDLHKRHPDIHIGISRGSFRIALRFIAPSLFFFLVPLSNLLSVQGTSILLSTALGSTALVLFVSSRTLANLVRQLFTATNCTLWPEITTLYACGDFSRLRALHWRVCKLSLSVSIAAAGFLYFFNGHIFRVWTGNRLQGDPVLMGLFLLNTVSTSLWYTSGNFQGAINMHKDFSIRWLLSAMSTLGLSFLLVPYWGSTGIAAALLLSELLFMSLGVMRRTCHIVNESTTRLLVDIARSCVPLAMILMVSAWALSLMCEQSWAGLIVGGILYAAIASTLIWFFLLLANERRRVWSGVCTLLARQS